MITFHYSAMDGGGRATTGRIDAASRESAIAELSRQRIFVTRITTDGEEAASSDFSVPRRTYESSTRRTPKLGARNLVTLWRQLATALEAGLPLLTALRVVRDQAESSRAGGALRDLVADLADRVESGDALSDALAQYPTTFTPLHVSMVRAGETAGVLDEVMGSLSEFAERDQETREQVRSASIYPMIVLCLAVASILVILTFILPRIMATVGDATAILPWPTRVLMSMSDMLRGYWWLLLIMLAAGIWGFRSWTAGAEGRFTFDALKLRVPLLGRTLRHIAVARFARALGTLTKSGIQIVEALGVLRDTLGNEAMGRTIDDVRAAVVQGRPIAEPLEQSEQFPPMFIQVVSLGERTGRLDQLLLHAADSFDKQASTSIQRTMTVLPALLIVVLALIVCFILAAVLLPIIGMNAAIPGM